MKTEKTNKYRIVLSVPMLLILLVFLCAVCCGCQSGDAQTAGPGTDTLSVETSVPSDDVDNTLPGTDTLADAGDAAEETTGEITEAITEDATECEIETEYTGLYHVCLFTGDITNNVKSTDDTLESAQKVCKKIAVYGYRICDDNGKFVWGPYTELQCDLLREAKWVVDYARTNGFKYGDAPVNPAINCDAKRVSCDRLVCWAYYRVGYKDQPYTQGLVVSNFFPWCERHGFEKITSIDDLEPGDIVGVRQATLSNGTKYPAHVFMYAGLKQRATNKKTQSWRYDCGSDTRIQTVQPMDDAITDFMVAYRPVIRQGTITQRSTGITLDMNNPDTGNLSLACELYVSVRDGDWSAPTSEIAWDYEFTLEGHTYRITTKTGRITDVETGNCMKLKSDDKVNYRSMIKSLFAETKEQAD